MVTSNTIIFVILIAKHSILTDFQMFREQIKNSVAYLKCILFFQQTKEDRSNEAAEESSSPVKKTFLRVPKYCFKYLTPKRINRVNVVDD